MFEQRLRQFILIAWHLWLWHYADGEQLIYNYPAKRQCIMLNR